MPSSCPRSSTSLPLPPSPGLLNDPRLDPELGRAAIGELAPTVQVPALDVAMLQLPQQPRDSLDPPDQEAQDAEKVVVSFRLQAGLKQADAHRAVPLRGLTDEATYSNRTSAGCAPSTSRSA